MTYGVSLRQTRTGRSGVAGARSVPATVARGALAKLDCLVVQDIFLTETAYLADVVLAVVVLVDERYTSVEAEARLRRAGAHKALRKQRIDTAAAQLILQQWFDEMRDDHAA